MSQTETVLKTARDLVASSWCKDLAKYRNEVTSPQGEWLPVSMKDPSKGFTFRDADAWSLTGALLRAEFLLDHEMVKVGSHSNDKPAWQKTQFSTNAYKFVVAVVKRRGYNYLADFNDPDKSRGKTTQEDVVSVMDSTLELYYALNVFV